MTGQAQTPGQAAGLAELLTVQIADWRDTAADLAERKPRGQVERSAFALERSVLGVVISQVEAAITAAAQERPAPELASPTVLAALSAVLADKRFPVRVGNGWELRQAMHPNVLAAQLLAEVAERTGAAQEPQPAVVVSFEGELTPEQLAEFERKFAEATRTRPDEVSRLRRRLAEVLASEAVTAAERDDLAQALDERNRQLDAFTHVVHDVTDNPVLAGTADALREQAGMTSIDQFSKPEVG